MGQGFKYVMGNKMLVTLGGCFAVAGLAIGLISPLGIFLVTENLGLPKEDLQWFMAANGIAMIIGGGATMGFSKSVLASTADYRDDCKCRDFCRLGIDSFGMAGSANAIFLWSSDACDPNWDLHIDPR